MSRWKYVLLVCAALFVLAYAREWDYRQNGWWTSFPSDTIEAPLAALIERMTR
jgi:hypothetical protein